MGFKVTMRRMDRAFIRRFPVKRQHCCKSGRTPNNSLQRKIIAFKSAVNFKNYQLTKMGSSGLIMLF
jgi:hypothetical protein